MENELLSFRRIILLWFHAQAHEIVAVLYRASPQGAVEPMTTWLLFLKCHPTHQKPFCQQQLKLPDFHSCQIFGQRIAPRIVSQPKLIINLSVATYIQFSLITPPRDPSNPIPSNPIHLYVASRCMLPQLIDELLFFMDCLPVCQ